MFQEAVNAGKPPAPAAAVTPTGPNEPPRSDQPSTAPLQMQAPAEGTGVGVEVVSAPNSAAQAPASAAQADPNALSSRSGPPTPLCRPRKSRPRPPSRSTTSSPARTRPAHHTPTNGKPKKPKVDLSDESSSKKKKKKGLAKLNPF